MTKSLAGTMTALIRMNKEQIIYKVVNKREYNIEKI